MVVFNLHRGSVFHGFSEPRGRRHPDRFVKVEPLPPPLVCSFGAGRKARSLPLRTRPIDRSQSERPFRGLGLLSPSGGPPPRHHIPFIIVARVPDAAVRIRTSLDWQIVTGECCGPGQNKSTGQAIRSRERRNL